MARATIDDFKNRLDVIDGSIFRRMLAEKEYFSFRVNLHKSTIKDAIELLQEEGFKPKLASGFENGFVLPESLREKIVKSKAYTQNLIYIQSLSSIFAANMLDVKSNFWVLDLAAAPGGKSLIFSEIAKKVSAVEPDKGRFFAMKRNFKKMGAKNIQTYNKDGRFVYKATKEWFDAVFLDAPCSSEAHIDIKKGITWWSNRRIYKFAKLQKELIISAFESLKANSYMIYATCTFAPEENEAVVNFLLKKYPNAKVVSIEHTFDNFKPGIASWQNEVYSPEVTKCTRVLPDNAFSGFFMAKIEKVF